MQDGSMSYAEDEEEDSIEELQVPRKLKRARDRVARLREERRQAEEERDRSEQIVKEREATVVSAKASARSRRLFDAAKKKSELAIRKLHKVISKLLSAESIVNELDLEYQRRMRDRLQKLTDYASVFGRVFSQHKPPGEPTEFPFSRAALEKAATDLGVKLPKNLGDVIYSFRYRAEAPQEIRQHEPPGKEWVVFGAGKGKYRFVLVRRVRVAPREGQRPIKILDSTPEIIRRYALKDEQALLAKIRYNRLVDLFLGIVAYPLQSHLRTTVDDVGQIEIDELYVGVDKQGAHFVVPVQAKGAKDRLAIVQAWQDMKFCESDAVFQKLIARPIGAQLVDDDTVAMFRLHVEGYDLEVVDEKHYRLLRDDASGLTDEDLIEYRHTSLASTEE